MPGLSVENLETGEVLTRFVPTLRTHCLGHDGLYLLPVELITRLDLSPEVKRLFNVYYDYEKHSDEAVYVNDEEYARLAEHSALTRAVVDAKRFYDALASDKSNLFGQLNELCRQLYINAAYGGRGSEADAALGAYAAIGAFGDYYRQLGADEKVKIPLSLKKQIERFFDIATTRDKDKTAAQLIETCIANQRIGLLGAMLGHERLLSEIGITGDHKVTLLESSRKQFEVAKSELEKALTDESYPEGQDHLGVNKKLLDALGIKPAMHSLRDLDLFKTLNSAEIIEICSDAKLRKQVTTQLAALENLVIFIMELAPDKVSVFLDVMKNELKRAFVNTPDDLTALLISLDIEKFKKVLMVDEFFTSVLVDNGLKNFLNKLTNEQERVVFKVWCSNKKTALAMVKQNSRALIYVPQDLAGYHEIALAAVLHNSYAFEYVPKDLAGYREIALAAIKQNGFAIRHVSHDIIGYNELVLYALEREALAIKYLPHDVEGYREIALEAVKREALALAYLPHDVEGYREIALEAVKRKGMALKSVPQDLAGYHEIALAAVMQNGFALHFIPQDLPDYQEIAIAAVTQDSSVLHLIPKNQVGYYEIVLAVVKQNDYVLYHIREDLPGYHEIALEAVKRKGMALQHFSEEIPGYHEIALVAVKQNGLALRFVRNHVPGYYEIALASVKQNGLALRWSRKDLPGYYEIALAAVKQNGLALEFVPKDIEGYREIALAAVNQNALAIYYVPLYTAGYREIAFAASRIGDIVQQSVYPCNEGYKYFRMFKDSLFGSKSHLNTSQIERIDALIATLKGEIDAASHGGVINDRRKEHIGALTELKELSITMEVVVALEQIKADPRFEQVMNGTGSRTCRLLNEIQEESGDSRPSPPGNIT